jgi:hypothetical protein
MIGTYYEAVNTNRSLKSTVPCCHGTCLWSLGTRQESPRQTGELKIGSGFTTAWDLCASPPVQGVFRARDCPGSPQPLRAQDFPPSTCSDEPDSQRITILLRTSRSTSLDACPPTSRTTRLRTCLSIRPGTLVGRKRIAFIRRFTRLRTCHNVPGTTEEPLPGTQTQEGTSCSVNCSLRAVRVIADSTAPPNYAEGGESEPESLQASPEVLRGLDVPHLPVVVQIQLRLTFYALLQKFGDSISSQGPIVSSNVVGPGFRFQDAGREAR